jgi:hypothetical protein
VKLATTATAATTTGVRGPKPPLGRLTDARIDKEIARKLCKRVADAWESVYAAPDIPERVLQNARERFLRQKDDVLSFVANSVDGKDGLAILTTGLCWRNTYRDDPQRVSWEQVRALGVRADRREWSIWLGREHEIDLSASLVEEVEIVKLLRNILRSAFVSADRSENARK